MIDVGDVGLGPWLKIATTPNSALTGACHLRGEETSLTLLTTRSEKSPNSGSGEKEE